MRASLLLVSVGLAGVVGGCSLAFDLPARPDAMEPDPDADPPGCNEPATILLRDPESLACIPFEDPTCLRHTSWPSWGVCGDACEDLSAAACAQAPRCRLIRGAPLPPAGEEPWFSICLPIDHAFAIPPADYDCFGADTGEACSRSPACTAYHFGTPLDSAPIVTFALCAPTGVDVGRCYSELLCDAAPPPCAAGKRPGIAAGCYTGACIPLDACESLD